MMAQCSLSVYEQLRSTDFTIRSSLKGKFETTRQYVYYLLRLSDLPTGP